MDLKGKVALITGAGSGMGAATARRFVADGAKVCINDIDREGLKQVAGSLPPGSVLTYYGDVSDPELAPKMVEATIAFGGKLNVLVNSAGMDPHDPEVNTNMVIFHKIIDVNLIGPYMLMRAAAPHMIKAGGGSIINIASLAGLRYMPGHSAYTVSKAGLIALTKEAAVEYGPSKVRSNVICPGATRTPMFENNLRPIAEMYGKDLEWFYKNTFLGTPLRRIAEPEEIAAMCAFLASDDSSLLTGGVLFADGGVSVVDASGAVASVLSRQMRESLPAKPAQKA